MDYEATIEDEDLDESKNKYILFDIDNGKYAIHIGYIMEIVSITEITPVPGYPDFARGVIDLRGDTIPIIDFRTVLKKGTTVIDKNNYCVITKFNEHKYGILVDKVSDIVDFGDTGVSSSPKASESYEDNFVIGVARHDGKIVMILDPTKVFDPTQVIAM